MLRISNEHLLRRLKHLPKTIECGIHSGFPACCISFYIVRLLLFSKQQVKNYWKKINQSSVSWGYIPCPDCLATNNMVEVKKCPIGHCWHAEECAGNNNEISKRKKSA